MPEITLSNGETITVPDGTTPEKERSYREQAEKLIAAESAPPPATPPIDDGTNPMAVDEHNILVDKGKNYAKSWVPEGDMFAAPDEWFTGVAEGFEKLPNIFPNTGNTVRDLYDLHFGSGKGLAAEDMYQPWYTEQKFKAPRPGWEGVREAGQVTGSAAPLVLGGPAGVLAAAVGVPAIVKGGGAAGATIDKLTGNEDTHKWERTGETLLPLAVGGVRAVKPLLSKIPVTKGTGLAAVTGTVSPEAAMAIMAGKLGIQGMDKLVTGPRPGGFAKGLDQTLKETGVGLRQDDDRRRRGAR